MEILNNLEPLQKLFWFIAIPASIVFIIQSIMTFVGLDSSDGIEADFDSNLEGADAPFQLFSFRNLINFLLGFSWAGLSLYSVFTSKMLLILVSLGFGVLFVFLFFVVIRQLVKLSENNTFEISNTLNKTAEVYLTIPERKTGKGKVLISVKGSVHELEAVTEKDAIKSGSIVKVVKIENGNLLSVEII